VSLPDIATLASYGGALNDYSPVIDPTVERSAAGANPAYNDVAAMTATSIRAWVRLTLNGSAVPALVAHNSNWGNAAGVAPTFTRSTGGIYTITWPATVYDAIPSVNPGATPAGHTLNLRAGWTNLRIVATAYDTFLTITAANVATLSVFNTSGSAADPGVATDVDVYVI
jgi:hypothetical protein